MGGVGKVIGELAEKEGPEIADKLLHNFDSSAEGMYKTARDILGKTEPGKIMLDHLDNVVIPQSRRTQQAYTEAAVSALPKNLTLELRAKAVAKAAADAKVKAWGDTKSTYLGKKDEGIIKTVYDATKVRGRIHGDNVADALTYVLHDAGEPFNVAGKDRIAPGWRARRVLQDAQGEGGISLKDVGIRQKSNVSNEHWERTLTQLSGWMNAPLIAIPHTGQLASVVLNTSIKSTAKALAEYSGIMDSGKDVMDGVIRSGVLADEINYELQQEARGLGLFEKMFHFPAFNFVRKQLLTVSALGNKHAYLEALADLAKDPTDKWATYIVNRLGGKVPELAEKGFKPTDQDILTAMFKGANTDIGIVRDLDVPWKWADNPWSRMGFQFKHFAYQNGRMIGRTLYESYKYGGWTQAAKTMTVFATLFPAMGELVHSMENIAQFKDPRDRDYKGVAEYFDAIGHVGGLGMFYSLWRAGLYYKGKGFLEGPAMSNTIGTGITLGYHAAKAGQALLEGDTWKAKRQVKEAARDSLFKLGWPGRIASNLIKKEMKDEI